MGGKRVTNMNEIGTDLQSLMMRSSKKGKLSKSLSRSTPSIAASFQTLSTKSLSTRSLSTTTSEAKNEKFHRYFSQVPIEEPVLNYYRCALVRDILLQGHLYITSKYIGFYSNVFGYVTKLLIPMSSVTGICKQKTVKIVPNAIGIATEESNHVFCSLFWKDSTFSRIKQIWEDSKYSKSVSDTLDTNNFLVDNSDRETNSEEERSNIFKNETDQTSESSTNADTEGFSCNLSRPIATMTRPRIITVILVVLLIALYTSAALMMMRINRLNALYLNNPAVSPESFIRNRLSQYIRLNLDQILQVRQSLQIMSKMSCH